VSQLRGGPELRRRLKAIGQTFKPYGRLWADTTAEEARRRVPVATGRLQKSIRRKSATAKRATVVGHYSGNFVDAGSKAHDINARRAPFLVFQAQGRTIFTRKVHKQRIAARRFKRPAAEAALRRHPMSETLIEQWNRAA
jgi:hypothetical protein